MEYVVGSVADLIAGNLTPSRPATVKRARTPVKHQPSPHVTPRAEVLPGGREALLSPTVLRKKAVVKKSPKRIFEKDDLDKTEDGDQCKSPKADKVKKHLQAQLDDSEFKSTKKVRTQKRKLEDNNVTNESESNEYTQGVDTLESVPKKKKKNKKNKGENKNSVDKTDNKVFEKESTKSELKTGCMVTSNGATVKTGKKKNKKKKNVEEQTFCSSTFTVTEKNDSESEHESDNEIESETEQDVKHILDSGPIEGENSSDEEEEVKQKNPKAKSKKVKEKNEKPERTISDEEEAKRTLFVGNVPLSKKCKKEIKQIFNQYGTIKTIRIRTIPVKDLRTGPKVSLIKNELHPERSTVNVYVKFTDESSVTKALCENNRLMGEKRLRVTRSDTSGAAHDPRRVIYVGNVPFGIEDDALRAKFEKCGEIESVRIVRDRASQIGKGFGYVNFASTDGVELALSLSEEDLTIKNRIMRLRRYTVAPPGQKVKGQFQKPNNRFNGPGGGSNYRSGSNGDQKVKGQFQKPNNRFNGPGGGSNYRSGSNGDQKVKGQFQKPNNRFNGPSGGSNYRSGSNGDQKGGGQWSRDRGIQGRPPRDDSGALKRINNKRKFQDNSTTGPPQKIQKNLNQPIKEKKAKKEFVGMTAEKKKKKKFDKGLKSKKKLSEILTKT